MQHTVLLTLATPLSAYAWPSHESSLIAVPPRPPPGAGSPLESWLSYSIEFSYFPDYAGNLSHPNTFSNNLLNNIAAYSGSNPEVRVGGSSEDNALFVESQAEGAILSFASPTSDQPSNLTFGPKYFESYHTWPNTKFVHGFNLKYNSTLARKALLASVPYACSSLRGKLVAWELGNEADLYTADFGVPGFALSRPESYSEADFVSEWLNTTRNIRRAMEDSCPDMASDSEFKFYAPSFSADLDVSELDQVKVWQEGLNSDNTLKVFSAHHYQAVAIDPDITLQRTLMNHTTTVESVNFLTNVSKVLRAQDDYAPSFPFILGEGNSIARQGSPGVSNSFGAALWSVDASLLMVSSGVERFHLHQGTNYRYQSWQPVNTTRVTIGTKAPYYGNVAVAAFLGKLTTPLDRPKVVNVPLPSELQACYASYIRGKLAKIMLVNLQSYNTTAGNNYTSTSPRGVQTFPIRLPSAYAGKTAGLQRLIANGSDAISGISFDGYSYNYELDNGKPVLLKNVTRGETAAVGRNGLLRVEVPDSSALIVNLV